VFEASGTHQLGQGTYLSEIPGLIHVAAEGMAFSEPDPEVHRTTNQGGTRLNENPAYGGWGGAQADASPYSTPLSVGTTEFPYGIGVLANSRLEVKAEGGFSRFVTQAGVDNATRNRNDRVVFEIYGDGRLLSRSDA